MFGNLSAKSREYVSDESGVSTVWALYWTIIFLVMAGFVIDASNAYRYRIVLQATADSSALGAIMSYREPQYYAVYMQDTSSQIEEFRGKEVAKEIAVSIMGEAQNKIVVGNNQIEFGSWDGSSFTVTSDPEEVDAAKVTALRTRANGNELSTLLLNMFNGFDSWDVGAVAIAHYYKELCPQKEGIMAGHTLNMESLGEFSGDLCLHGEIKVDINVDNKFSGETSLSWGLDGEVCKGVCSEEKVVDANPDLAGRLGAQGGLMPDVPEMFEKFKYAIEYPEASLNDPVYQEYIPEALVSGVDDDGLPTSLEVADPDTDPTVQRVNSYDGEFGNGDGDDFEEYLKNPDEWTHQVMDDLGQPVLNADGNPVKRPLNPNTVYKVIGCGGDKTITFDDDWLTDVVIATDCQINFTADVVMSGSTILTTWGDPSYIDGLSSDVLTKEDDYKGSPAFTGSSGTQIGTGTCNDPAGASKLIAAGDINVASGMVVNYSQLLTKGDMHIAANTDGMQGTTAWAWGDIDLTSGGKWNGCNKFYTSDQTISNYYRLVF